MSEKTFVLVNQGIVIDKTKSQEKALKEVTESNNDYFAYLRECEENYERAADSYVELEIEYEETEILKKMVDKMATDIAYLCKKEGVSPYCNINNCNYQENHGCDKIECVKRWYKSLVS